MSDMKKGFTLIEIIVSLVLLSLIGTVSIVAVNKSNETNKLEKITKEILEAANVYFSVEKDDNGKTFMQEIYSGAKGVKIPLAVMVDKGYIEKNDINKLETELGISHTDNKSLYILFVAGGEGVCDDNQISTITSWKSAGKQIVLCENSISGGVNKKIDPSKLSFIENQLINNCGSDKECDELRVDDIILKGNANSAYYSIEQACDERCGDICSGVGSFDIASLDIYHNQNSGLKFDYDSLKYYYHGYINNNYVKFDGSDDLYRILSFVCEETYCLNQKGNIILIKEKGMSKVDYESFNNDYIFNNYENMINAVEKYNKNVMKCLGFESSDIYISNIKCNDNQTNIEDRSLQEKKYHLIDEEDLHTAGVAIGITEHSSYTNYIIDNKSWLTTGGSMITSLYYNNSQVGFVVDHKDGDSYYNGVLSTTLINADDFVYRPVISLNNCKVKIKEGNGRKSSPYILQNFNENESGYC